MVNIPLNALQRIAVTNLYEQYEYDDSGNMIYSGGTDDVSKADGDDGWIIRRYWYTDGGQVEKTKVLGGTWTGRVDLAW